MKQARRPNPYRLLLPETLRALARWMTPDLLAPAAIAAVAQPERTPADVKADYTAPDVPPVPADVRTAELAVDPHSSVVRVSLGAALEEEGRIDAALEQYEAANVLAVEQPYAWLRIARVLSRTGRHAAAARAARAVLTLDADNVEARSYVEQADEVSP